MEVEYTTQLYLFPLESGTNIIDFSTQKNKK